LAFRGQPQRLSVTYTQGVRNHLDSKGVCAAEPLMTLYD